MIASLSLLLGNVCVSVCVCFFFFFFFFCPYGQVSKLLKYTCACFQCLPEPCHPQSSIPGRMGLVKACCAFSVSERAWSAIYTSHHTSAGAWTNRICYPQVWLAPLNTSFISRWVPQLWEGVQEEMTRKYSFSSTQHQYPSNKSLPTIHLPGCQSSLEILCLFFKAENFPM